MTTATVPIEHARITWLDLMIPQLEAGGFRRLAAEYAVERDRLARKALADGFDLSVRVDGEGVGTCTAVLADGHWLVDFDRDDRVGYSVAVTGYSILDVEVS